MRGTKGTRRRDEDVPDGDLKEDFWDHCAMKKGINLQAPAARADGACVTMLT
jgi:hypothetical protein